MNAESFLKQRLVCVAVIDQPDDAVPLTEALLAGGLNCIEVTFRTAGAAESIARIRKAAKESVAVYNKLWGAKENASKEAVIKGGAKIIPAAEVDHKGFVDAQKPVWDKYANTPELKALVQEIVNTK